VIHDDAFDGEVKHYWVEAKGACNIGADMREPTATFRAEDLFMPAKARS
jgi:hypothetical protein